MTRSHLVLAALLLGCTTPAVGDEVSTSESSSTSDTTGEPEYGVPDTGVDTSSSSDTSTDSTSDTGTTAEPLYGLADSGEQ